MASCNLPAALNFSAAFCNEKSASQRSLQRGIRLAFPLLYTSRGDIRKNETPHRRGTPGPRRSKGPEQLRPFIFLFRRYAGGVTVLPDVAPIVIDALNVAYWCGRPAQLRLPLVLANALRERGHAVLLCFDASTPYKVAEQERMIYERLLQPSPLVLPVPSGTPADRVMLRHARAHGACIVSRDKFADHRKRYRKLVDDPARLLSGFVFADALQIPGLGLHAPLLPSAVQALERLRI